MNTTSPPKISTSSRRYLQQPNDRAKMAVECTGAIRALPAGPRNSAGGPTRVLDKSLGKSLGTPPLPRGAVRGDWVLTRSRRVATLTTNAQPADHGCSRRPGLSHREPPDLGSRDRNLPGRPQQGGAWRDERHAGDGDPAGSRAGAPRYSDAGRGRADPAGAGAA